MLSLRHHSVSPLLQVSVAIGCAVQDRNVVFASTFATFFTRAYDQLRMAAISESNINLCGSHCGVSIGQCLALLLSVMVWITWPLTFLAANFKVIWAFLRISPTRSSWWASDHCFNNFIVTLGVSISRMVHWPSGKRRNDAVIVC